MNPFAPRRILAHHHQDRYAGLSGPGGFRGGLRGLRGGFRGGLRGFSGRGGFGRGGGGGFGGAAAGRDFSNQDLYADYIGPDQQSGGLRMDGYGAPPAAGFSAQAGYGAAGYEPEPSQQIMVRNVCDPLSSVFMKC